MIDGLFRAASTVRDVATAFGEIGRALVMEAARAITESSERPGSAEEPKASVTDDVSAAFSRLLEISTGPKSEAQGHPAFRAIVDEISPDEARIIRLFARQPEQPLLHVRAVPRYGLGATMVVENFSLIGQDAGCHYPERAASYLDNLCRLGLLRIHDERVADRELYEVLQVHPEIASTARRIREEMGQRVRFDHLLARLTPFGRRFCDDALAPSP